ncbi:small acid-soluble spore protein O [Anaerobacillus sp. HL2]|nr:small acid-soluble spore protein O [Anaerobacillus sp. HL2]
MAKRKANHIIPGMNHARKPKGIGTGCNEEFSNEPLTEEQKQFNRKRKKDNRSYIFILSSYHLYCDKQRNSTFNICWSFVEVLKLL